jgi:hypothetical protein
VLEGRHRAVHLAEVGDLRDAAHLVWGDLVDRSEDARHRVVDPDVDRAELGLGALGGGHDVVGVRDVGGEHQRTAAGVADLARRRIETVLAASQ